MNNPSTSREILMASSTRASTIDGVLEIGLHHATGIHNICIYGNQDVYAKFSITHSQDAVYSTQPVRGGGKNPVFNQSLQILISKADAVLKCEVWMLSCAKTYLEDQLLGFVLVPLCDVFGQGRVTKFYSLSSTDLFHTPAGTICLSLTFYLRGTDTPLYAAVSSKTSSGCTQNGLHNTEEDGPLDKSGNGIHAIDPDSTHDMLMNTEQCMNPQEYNKIEFPDLHDASENQHLVSIYLNTARDTDANMDEDACGKEGQPDGIMMRRKEKDFSGGSFLQLGSAPMALLDSDMGIQNGTEKICDGPLSPSCSAVSPEDVNAVTSKDMPMISKAKEVQFLDCTSASIIQVPSHSAQKSISPQAMPSPTSTILGGGIFSPVVKMVSSSNGQESQSSFAAPIVSLPLKPEEPVVQRQIVDMYMKSMQQFTESLAMMKLPLDLDNTQGRVERNNESRAEKEGPSAEPTIKDGHRVFYGSRAFF